MILLASIILRDLASLLAYIDLAISTFFDDDELKDDWEMLHHILEAFGVCLSLSVLFKDIGFTVYLARWEIMISGLKAGGNINKRNESGDHNGINSTIDGKTENRKSISTIS
jgi:hypothetical protein